MYKTRWSSTVFPHPMTTDPSRTPAPARSALEFAALLPPDRVPWLWLKAGESKPNAPPPHEPQREWNGPSPRPPPFRRQEEGRNAPPSDIFDLTVPVWVRPPV